MVKHLLEHLCDTAPATGPRPGGRDTTVLADPAHDDGGVPLRHCGFHRP
ncbi:hypothetical protein ABZY90_00185 [Streptomyces sp. NPDC006422]